MKKPVKTSVITVMVFTAALFGIYSCLNLSHENITENLSGNWLGISEDSTDVSEYHFDPNIGTIQVQWYNGTVSVSSYDQSDITVMEVSDDMLQIKQHLTYRIENDILYIVNGETSDASLFHLSEPEINCEIYLPSELILNAGLSMVIETSHADVQISRVSLESLSVTTDSGNMIFDSMNTLRLTAKTSSGAISSSGGFSAVIEMKTQSGNIDLSDSCNDLILETTSGKITAAPYEMFLRGDIRTISGNIYLTLPDCEGIKLKLNQLSGNFNCELDVSSNNGYYLYKNGRVPLNISTTSGNVELYQKK